MEINQDTLEIWSPFLLVFLGIVLVLLADLLFRERAREIVVGITTFFLVGTSLWIVGLDENAYTSDIFSFGDFFKTFAVIGLLSSLIVVFSAWKDLSIELDLGVFFSLLLLANLGGMLVAASRSFIPLYVGYELVSIPTYAMVAFRKRSRTAAEAGLKIFLLGALSSAIIIYGLSMYYGATGTLQMGAAALEDSEGLKVAAITLIAAGSGFKIGLVPFHFWIADVYSGAPVSVVNFLSASSKKMAFAFVFQLFLVGMGNWADTWGLLFAILATLSMLLGNIAATIQSSMMRIIAYSTIAQAGYIVIGMAAFAVGLDEGDISLQNAAMKGILFHIIAHVLMKGATIAAVLIVIDSYGDDKLENFRGLLHKSPLLAGSLALAMFSLMGIPPLGGFFGKFFLFLAAVDADLTWLALVGVAGSAISIFYYANVIRIMVDKPTDDTPIKSFTPITVLLVVLSILTICLGLFGDQIVELAENIVSSMIIPS
ncbi:MAG: NADH-quinone oxidoreductase subunit N [Candidatus Kariarchaeaceae archaeon]|jgi:NADH-quinone oxidoreductase subunit N